MPSTINLFLSAKVMENISWYGRWITDVITPITYSYRVV